MVSRSIGFNSKVSGDGMIVCLLTAECVEQLRDIAVYLTKSADTISLAAADLERQVVQLEVLEQTPEWLTTLRKAQALINKRKVEPL